MNDKYKILLVEDEPELAMLFSTALKQAGFNIETVQDGNEAMGAFQKIKPDLVLLDLVLPNRDGYDILKDIKCDKVVKNTMIYIFSNLTQADEIEKAMKLGAKDYLIKSDYTPAKLVEKVQEIFCLKGNKECC